MVERPDFNMLQAYKNSLLRAEALIYTKGRKIVSKLGIGYIFNGSEYYVDRSRNDVVERELDDFASFWEQTHDASTEIFKTIEVGSGLGFGGYGIASRLNRFPNFRKEIVLTNIVHPPDFVLPISSENTKFKAISNVIAELPPSDLIDVADLLYTDGSIQWSRYPDVFLEGIYAMLKKGSVAAIITFPKFGKFKMIELLKESPFRDSFAIRAMNIVDSLQGEKAYLLYKPIGKSEELPDFCRRTRRNLSVWDTLI